MKISNILLICFSILSFSACRDSKPFGEETDTGWLNLGIKLTQEKIETRTATTDTLPDFSIKITNNNNDIIKSYANQDKIPEQLWLLTGNYKVSAISGTNENAAFNSPYYIGEKVFGITANTGTSIELPVILSNAKVGVTYSERVINNFPDRTVKINNGLKQLTFTKNENRQGYFKITEQTTTLNWDIEFVNNDGKLYIAEGIINAPKINTYYKITFDIEQTGDGIGGVRIFPIIVEETVTKVEHNQDIIITPYPGVVGKLNGEKFLIDEIQNILYNDQSSKFNVEISGFPAIKTLSIQHNISDLTDLGIGSTIEFYELNTAAQQTLNDAGIFWTQNSSNNLITFDLSRLAQALKVNTENSDPYQLTFTVTDLKDKRTEKTISFNIFNSDVKTTSIKGYDMWSRHIVVKGNWLDIKPGSVYFEYRKKGEITWMSTQASGTIQIDHTSKTFSDVISNLEPNTDYQIRAVGTSPGNTVTATSDNEQQLPNMSFDSWNGNNPWNSADGKYWDTGNEVASMASTYMTSASDERPNGISTGKSAMLESKFASAVGVGAFAAGNLFIGNMRPLDLIGNGANGMMDFGRPYSFRPTKLTGYYKYHSEKINYDKKGLSGKNDRFHIYIMLTTWNSPHFLNTKYPNTFFNMTEIRKGNVPEIIGFAELTNESITDGTDNTPAIDMKDFEYFELPIRYFRTDIKPSYIVIAASSSMYGDYFTGGVGSKLFVDEFKLAFE